MRLSTAPAAVETVTRLPRGVLLATGLVAAAAFALFTTGTVELPDWEAILTDVADALGAWTYLLVGAFAFLETGAFVGLVAPGETAVVLGGVVAAQGQIDLPAMLLVAWGAAALGDLASFLLGRRLGRPFLDARGARVGLTQERIKRVEDFFGRHGAKAILVGRFVGIVRAVAPFLAGAARMPLRSFLPWSLLGTALWATTFTLVGYAFENSFSSVASGVTKGALALAVVAAIGLAWHAHRQSRRAPSAA